MKGQPRYFEYDRRLPWNIALATQCLSELKNLDQVNESAERLLMALCRCFDNARLRQSQSFAELLKNEVAPAAENIGTNWPRCNWFVEWLHGYITFNSSLVFAEAFGIFVGSVGFRFEAIHKTILDNLDNPDKEFRFLLVFALVAGWKNSQQTERLLRKLAINDQYQWVRHAASTALATNYRDADGTLELIRDRAVNNPDPTADAVD